MRTKEEQVLAFNQIKEEMLQRISEKREGEKDFHEIIGATHASDGTKQRETVLKALNDTENWHGLLAVCLEGSEDFADFLGILMTVILNRENRIKKEAGRLMMLGALLND